MPLRTVIAPQLSQLGASVWKLANCSVRLEKVPPFRSTFITPARSNKVGIGRAAFWACRSLELGSPDCCSWPAVPPCHWLGRPILARSFGSPALVAASVWSLLVRVAFAGRFVRQRLAEHGLAIAGQERDAQPAEDVIDDALGDADVGILGVPHRLEAGVRELVHVHFQRHAVLQAHRDGRAEAVHQPADRAAFLGHRDEQFARPAVFVQADRDVALVPGDVELVRDAAAGVGQIARAAAWPTAWRRPCRLRCWSTAAGSPSSRRDRRPAPSAPAANLPDRRRRRRPAWSPAAC